MPGQSVRADRLARPYPESPARTRRPVGRKKKQRLDAIKKKDWNALSSVMTEHFLEVGEWVLEGNRRRFRICRLI